MINCKEAVRLMSGEMDRAMAFGERLALRLHMAICAGCRNYRGQMKFLRAACRQMQAGETAAADDEAGRQGK